MIKYFDYTWRHKLAFLKVEKVIFGKNSFRGYFHDIDKLFLYILFFWVRGDMIEKTKKDITKYHKAISRHHKRARNKKDYKEILIDWECSRFTKPDKPFSAYETLELPNIKRNYCLKTRCGLIDLIEKYDLKEKKTAEYYGFK